MSAGVRQLMEDLRSRRVLVVHPLDREGDALVAQLKRIGCQVKTAWPAPRFLPDETDTVFCLIDKNAADAPGWMLEDRTPTFIAIIDYENPTILRAVLDANAHGVISKPIRAFGILSTLVLARSQHSYTARLDGKVRRLEETLKSRRDIEKAVRILATMRGLAETEAYEFVRGQATKRRVSMAQIAAAIITTQDLLDDKKG